MASFDMQAFVSELSKIHDEQYTQKLHAIGKSFYQEFVLPEVVNRSREYRDAASAGFSGKAVVDLDEQTEKALKHFFETEKIKCYTIRNGQVCLVWCNDY